MTRARLLQPKFAAAEQLFHWTNWGKASTAIKNNKLSARRWEHYIDGEDRMVKGTSWSKEPTRWQFAYTVRLRIDPSKVQNNKFEINGDYVYYKTQHIKGLRGPSQHEVFKNSKANETFIEGTIVNLRNAIISIKIVGYDPDFTDLVQDLGITIEESR